MKHMKRTLCALLTLALTLSLCALPASAADEPDWKAACRDAVSKNADTWGSVCQLADFNLDGTPELIIGGVPGSGLFSVIRHAFTFRGGAAVEISVPDEYLKLGDSYELYRNDSTGETRVEGRYVVRVGHGSASHATADYFFDGSAFGYVTTFVTSEDMGKKTCYVGDKAVSAAQYDSAYNSRNSGWTQLDFPVSSILSSKKPTSAEIDELINGYTPGRVVAAPSSHRLQVNGTPVSAAAYTVGGSNYFKLRDLAMLLTATGAKFEVGYDSASNSITLTTGRPYTPAGGELAAGGGVKQLGSRTASAIFIDGRSVELAGYSIGGSNYFKLRDLGEALGFDVGWDDAARTVSISAGE